MAKSAAYVSDLSPYSNGRAIEEYIKERVYAKDVAKIKMYAKSALLICNLGCPWTSGIRDVAKMGSIC